MTAVLSPSERSYILTGLSHPTQPTRVDGRGLLDSRPIEVSFGDAPQASGSSRVRIGNTEVLAGIRLEVEDVDPEGEGEGSGGGWRTKVEVDVSPQAFPLMDSRDLAGLSTHYADILTDCFTPSIPPFPIIPPTKYFVPYLHLTVLSTSGNLLTVLTLAARAAFQDLRIPRTKHITLEAFSDALEGAEGDLENDYSGLKAAVRGAGRGKGKGRSARGDDWDLEGGEDTVPGREGLPVLVTLNVVPQSQAVFLDATLPEEAACPDRMHCWFNGAGKVCGIRTEGTSGWKVDRIPGLLHEAKRISTELFQSLESASS